MVEIEVKASGSWYQTWSVRWKTLGGYWSLWYDFANNDNVFPINFCKGNSPKYTH